VAVGLLLTTGCKYVKAPDQEQQSHSQATSTANAPPTAKQEPVENKVELYDYAQDEALTAKIETATRVQSQPRLNQDDIDTLCSGSESLRSKVEQIRTEAATKATSADLQSEYFNSRLEQARIDWTGASRQAIKYFTSQRESLRASKNQKWLKLSLTWKAFDVPHELLTTTTTSGQQLRFPVALSIYDSIRGLVSQRWSDSMRPEIEREAFVAAFDQVERNIGQVPYKEVVMNSSEYKDAVSNLYSSYAKLVDWQEQYNNNVAFAGHLDNNGKALDSVVLYDKSNNHLYCKFKGTGIPVALVQR
jgi:hypothetical protein